MKSLILTLLKYISLPLALLYGIVVSIRNKFYDSGLFSSISFSLPVICVGNITVGGTGKSPHIEYLIEQLMSQFQLATLSRGYKRYSRGFKLADEKSNARDLGDEPFQFKSKYPSVEVCVAEERMTAIPQLLQRKPHVEVILLDDAFQHRTVKAGVNILLTDYDRLYTRDYIMPFGLLRESRKAANRAQIIIISKCAENLSLEEKNELIQEINPNKNQQVFFTSIQYKTLYPLYSFSSSFNHESEVLMVSGIANPKPLEHKLQQEFKRVYALNFKDHHYFTFDDIDEIKETFDNIKASNKIIITTEKDVTKLILLQDKIKAYQLPIFIQGIGIHFLFNEAEQFNTHIESYIRTIIPPIQIEDDPNSEMSSPLQQN